MINKPLISIITVCYNSERTIIDTLESVLKQNYKNYEYIIIDGNSTDKTLKIISEYERKFEGRMKYISEKDEGIYDAMNKGIRLCKGDIIGIINSDDWYEEGCLDKVAKLYNKDENQIMYGYQRLIKNEKEYEIVMKNHQFIKERMISHPTCFVSRTVYDKYGLYNLNFRISADYEFMLRLSKYDDIKYVKLYDIISNFRLGGESSTLNGVIETAKIRLKYGCITNKQYYSILAKTKISYLLKKIFKK